MDGGKDANGSVVPSIDHTSEHNAVVEALADSAIEAFGDEAVDVDVRDGSAAAHSESHIPDIAIHTPFEVVCAEVQGCNPFKIRNL